MQEIKGFLMLLGGAMLATVVLVALGTITEPMKKDIEHSAMVKSHQYKEGMEQQAAILEASIAEAKERLATAKDDEKKAIESQLRLYNVRLDALKIRGVVKK